MTFAVVSKVSLFFIGFGFQLSLQTTSAFVLAVSYGSKALLETKIKYPSKY